jgi:uncharacterized membrane protein
VSFAQAKAIVLQRCAPCHHGIASPAGVDLQVPELIKQNASGIKAMAVDTHAMPLGNKTGMTQGERDILARWLAGR